MSSHIDLEQGRIGDRRLSFTAGEDVVSCVHSNTYGYYDDYDNDEYSRSDESEKRVCRICQLEVGSYGQGLIELGCSCKDDLALAHLQCAETWFKLKGNDICEICHSEARNLASGNEMREEGSGGGGGRRRCRRGGRRRELVAAADGFALCVNLLALTVSHLLFLAIQS